jgi:hypothetical protein
MQEMRVQMRDIARHFRSEHEAWPNRRTRLRDDRQPIPPPRRAYRGTRKARIRHARHTRAGWSCRYSGRWATGAPISA